MYDNRGSMYEWNININIDMKWEFSDTKWMDKSKRYEIYIMSNK